MAATHGLGIAGDSLERVDRRVDGRRDVASSRRNGRRLRLTADVYAYMLLIPCGTVLVGIGLSMYAACSLRKDTL
jgi:hypothetical protein